MDLENHPGLELSLRKYAVKGNHGVVAELSATLETAQPSESYGLTPRELEMVRFVTQGCSNREIATQLNISEETVKRHLSNVFDKVGMSNRVELTLFALEHRLAVAG